MKKISTVFALLLATGCSGYSLEELRHVEPKGSEFSQALTRRYLDFAEEHAKRYNWQESAYFAGKGLLAAYDSEVGPEDVAAYSLSEENKALAEKARADLLVQLSDKNRTQRPAVAADAQFFFDCWLSRQQKGTKPDEIAYCRDHFKERMDELADTSYEKTLREMGELGPEIETTSYIVFFDWGQAIVTEMGTKVIDEVVSMLKPQDNYEVVLNGHTDASGDSKYNLQLSKRRAEAVKEKLVAGGVKESAIKIFAFGESDPIAKTKDGKKEKNNRRVEIFLGE